MQTAKEWKHITIFHSSERQGIQMENQSSTYGVLVWSVDNSCLGVKPSGRGAPCSSHRPGHRSPTHHRSAHHADTESYVSGTQLVRSAPDDHHFENHNSFMNLMPSLNSCTPICITNRKDLSFYIYSQQHLIQYIAHSAGWP